MPAATARCIARMRRGYFLCSIAQACHAMSRQAHGFSGGVELAQAIRQGTASVVEREGRITGYATVLAFLGHTTAAWRGRANHCVLRRLRKTQLAPIKTSPINSCALGSGAVAAGAAVGSIWVRNSWTCPDCCTGPVLVMI